MTEDRKKLLEEVRERAIQCDINYGGCSQSVLASLQEVMNIGNESTFMAGAALAGGGARGGETCGALSGMLMAIGIVASRKRIDNIETHKVCMKLAIAAREIFRERVGNTLCAKIQESFMGRAYKMSDDRERERFHEDGGHARDKCPGVCGKAAVIAAEIILQRDES